ncbi:MAG: hypothetical protein DI596_10970 [Azospira oryzae]|uniref:Uncharacterized protein n=1 Tax=Pelomicrobium methylotrophicum TaxID=2602750 RepID=A0A5C7EGP6_9PROT|nr:hypothetical protein [Pelomicrobium methylotrophicum]PZP55883.1 MAG: hypothetical protein DI596_10970 [Azospira oryzae]PZP78179.1 MAG: hypothetical protein DI593_10970 [Azospira oryzae]TXF11151.1 hypothetical protein FR698_11590 [Pelomicrobium methylotrophicum]
MFFEKKIDLRSKQAMVAFLCGHHRYYTMNSWNRTTSYANRIKIPYLGLTQEQVSRAYDILDTDYWDELQFVIDDFTSEMDGNYTIGVNGRSGGYLVLYRGEYYDPGYKSRCRACGQLNYQAVSGEVGQCGRCGKMERVNFSKPLRWHRVLPGQGIDQGESFEDWSMQQLRERVELVCRFDRACDEIRNAFIDLLDNCCVIEETVMVPKTVRRIVCAAA